MNRVFWEGKKVCVVGGASFIGSHLCEALMQLNCRTVDVLDDLSTGLFSNIEHLTKSSGWGLHFHRADVREVSQHWFRGYDVVFHLAAVHGGRGFIDLRPADVSINLAIDASAFHKYHAADVERIVFASSGCVYPTTLQHNVRMTHVLQEEEVGPPYQPDGMYGFAKLASEECLEALWKQYGQLSASCRFFTAYGPRALEDHAIMAMIARAFIDQSPFELWGNGEQRRNWTYVSDIVNGLLIGAEKCDTAGHLRFNVGSGVSNTVREAADFVQAAFASRYPDYKLAPYQFLTTKPVGVLNRVCDTFFAESLGWECMVPLRYGIERTVEWYVQHKDRDQVREQLENLLKG